MARIKIYKNREWKIDAGTDWDYEKFKATHGYYTGIDLMMKLLETKPDLQNKIMLEQDFALSKEEKDTIAKRIEEYIEKDIRCFIEADETEIYKNVVYKNKIYKAPLMRSRISLEKKLLTAMSLYNQFNDPNNSDIIEFKFG
ncbi:hypothetical protein [Chryseobacterium sp. Leaf394]|uniref:hypothetical protein n=1 Tax=Chryseobacterium sp. Leaf394 TaxID=1736361 RepID=UPI0006F2539D|nr:hypothetical protein [Chryseobacterium sp. Leaf394]KQS94317.1 hypothetical protein ASG21_19000 [Chryseobacterium sp. Leaf394]